MIVFDPSAIEVVARIRQKVLGRLLGYLQLSTGQSGCVEDMQSWWRSASTTLQDFKYMMPEERGRFDLRMVDFALA